MKFMTILACLTAAGIFFHAVRPLKLKWYYQLLLGLVIILACFKNLLVRLIGGPLFFAPDLPGWLLMSLTALYAVAMMYFFLVLVAWLGKLFYRIILKLRKRPLPESFERWSNRINLILLASALLLTSLAMYNALKLPAVCNLTIRSEQLPAAADNFKIAVLADLHIDAVTRPGRIERIVDMTNALGADMIVLLGDMVDGTVDQRGHHAEILKKLSAPAGVYAVFGNHDYYSGYSEWMKFFASSNIKILENSHLRLPNGIYLAGTADFAAQRVGAPLPDLAQAAANIPEKSYTILLAHRPGIAPEASALGIDLQLSGHTHGGMLPLLNWAVGKYNSNFISGIYQLDRMILYVSNGSAIWSGFPLRLNCDSEITLITLQN